MSSVTLNGLSTLDIGTVYIQQLCDTIHKSTWWYHHFNSIPEQDWTLHLVPVARSCYCYEEERLRPPGLMLHIEMEKHEKSYYRSRVECTPHGNAVKVSNSLIQWPVLISSSRKFVVEWFSVFICTSTPCFDLVHLVPYHDTTILPTKNISQLNFQKPWAFQSITVTWVEPFSWPFCKYTLRSALNVASTTTTANCICGSAVKRSGSFIAYFYHNAVHSKHNITNFR